MRSFKSLAVLVSAFVFAGSVVGCDEDATNPGPLGGDGAGGEGGGPIEPEAGMAMVRVVHSSSDAPAVDIWANGAPLVENIQFGDASEWINVPPGSYDLEIKAAGSSVSEPAVYTVNGLVLVEGEKVSAIAAGLLTSTADSSKFRVLPVREEFAPAGSGNAILRVIHASPDAPTVGIDLHNDDPSSPELSNIDRFGTTAEAGFPLTAGEALQIGIAAGGSTVTAFTTPELPEGAEILVIATGLVGEKADEADGFSLLAIGPTGALGFVKQNPFVYALHASPNAPAVDLYAGDAKLAGGLSFGNLAGPVQVPPSDYKIDFRAAGADPTSAPAASAQTGAIAAGGTYLSIATGFLGGTGAESFRLVSLQEQFADGSPDSALGRVVHGSPDAPKVDLGVLNVEGVVSPVLIPDLTFGDATGPEGLDLGIGTLPLGVTPADANSTVVASFHVTTAPGLRAFAIASGALSAEKGESFRLLVVDTATSPWSVATIHPQPQ
jgi:hypothetical protein